jgi:fermentation-respiration switch protein FrsA (DUF1100 family)
MELLLVVIRIVAGVYVGLTLLVYLRQTSFIYYPEKTVDLGPSDINLAFRDVSLKTDDGETITGWYVPAATETAAPVLLFFHGNAGNIAGRLGSIQTFHDLGLNVLIIDYHGYGQSTGKPTEKGTILDSVAAWEYLTGEMGITPDRIIIFGRSLGGAVAAGLAARHTPGMLVVESSFTSTIDLGQRMFPYLPVRLLSRHPYDNETSIQSVPCPVLIAHGPDDTTIPFAHGKRLYEVANEPKQFVELAGGHNESGMDYDRAYRAVFKEWVDRYVADGKE